MTGRSAPVLETERLILRRFERSDFDAHCAILAQPEVNRHLGPLLSREDIWRRALAGVGNWSVAGFGGWMATSRRDGRLLGNVGLFNAWRDMQPEFGDQPEMGWIFAREVHGQGIAGEACQAVLAWADANRQPTPVWAMIAPENQPSLRLGERLGFERLADSVYQGEAIAVLRRPSA
jgi:RimJ/RimL family protein N-acetyltransferase